MNYDNLSKKIDEKISKYKQSLKNNYYTYYYYEALNSLDTCILNISNGEDFKKDIRRDFVISEALDKANTLHEDKYIYKNYILSLIIENKQKELKDILDINKFYYEEEQNNIEKAIYFFIEGFLDNTQFNNEEKLDSFKFYFDDYDYVDYRILYILYKKYNIDVFGHKEDYIIYSYDNVALSRKTIKSKLLLYSAFSDKYIKENIDYILQDINYIDKIKNKGFHHTLINNLCEKFKNKEHIKFMYETIDDKNREIYEYLLEFMEEDLYYENRGFFDYIIYKYCEYIRYTNLNGQRQKNIINKILKENKEEAILAYYNLESSKYLDLKSDENNKKIKLNELDLEVLEDKNLILKKLREKTTFTEKEYLLIEDSDDEYLRSIIENLYMVELTYGKKQKAKLVFKFDGYPQSHIQEYDNMMYYYLPILKSNKNEKNKELNISILKEKTLKEEEYDFFVVEGVESDLFLEKLALSYCKDTDDIKNGLSSGNISYKFSTYILYSNIDKFIDILNKNKIKFDKIMVDIILESDSLFNKYKYEDILKEIKIELRKNNKSSSENKALIKNISEKLGDIKEKQKNLYNMIDSDKKVNSKKEFEDVIDEVMELDSMGVNIQHAVFTKVVKMAYNNDYYGNMQFISLCEKYIYDNKLVDRSIYEYIEKCYQKKYFVTDKTESVLKLISFYKDNKKLNENYEVNLNYWIKTKKYDDKFIDLFKELYNFNKNSSVLKECVDFMLNENNYNLYINDKDIIAILEDIYDNLEGYYKCLEAIIYRYIKNNCLEKIKSSYIKDIISYYVNSKLITDCSSIIVQKIYEEKYYEKLDEKLINDFMTYLLESLKYEIIRPDDLMSKYGINPQGSIFISIEDKYLNYVKGLKSNKLLKLEYVSEYKINNKTVKRNFLEESNILIDQFEYLNDSYKKEIANKFIMNNGYNTTIYDFVIDNKLFENNNKKEILKKYLYEEIRKKEEIHYHNYIKILMRILEEVDLEQEDIQYIENTLYILGNFENENKEFDLFKEITQKYNIVFSSKYISHLIDDYIDLIEEYIELDKPYFIKYFKEYFLKDDCDEKIFEVFKLYISKLESINKNNYKIIFDILNKFKGKENKNRDIIDIIVNRGLETEKDNLKYNVILLLEICKNFNYRRKEIHDLFLNDYDRIKKVGNIDAINQVLLNDFEGSLEQFDELLEFVKESKDFLKKREKLIDKKREELANKE